MRRVVERWIAAAACVAAIAAGSAAVASTAVADTAPGTPGTPTTVTADPLPTVQINGVAWKQQIVGNRVYVGGSFTTARPAGAAAGTGEVTRTYLLAYDLTTGVLVDSFAPTLDAQVKDMAVSPDGSTLYVVGSFTKVNGLARYRVAAFDTTTGALTSFAPYSNGPLGAVVATSSAVYLAGTLTQLQGVARSGIGAVSPSTAAVLPFAPTPAGGKVQAMVVAPDGASLILGGAFTSMNGSSSPGLGLARVSTAVGSSLPLPVDTQVRDAGTGSAILSLTSDGTNFYGSGYAYGGGNLEGSFAADWATGTMIWIEDCHGDTYSVFSTGSVVYSASHKHYCGDSGGFGETSPRSYHRATATSTYPSGVNTADPYGYWSHTGQAKPELLSWYPDINTGTYTGLSQGPWTVTGNATYVLYGGEFTQVGGLAQQGLVRFAVKGVAPGATGPTLSGAKLGLTARSGAAGRVEVSWNADSDPDNRTLTYRLYRGSVADANLIWSQTADSPFWDSSAVATSFVDTGLSAGATVRYRLTVTDPDGNTATSDFAATTVAAAPAASLYARTVEADLPTSYWRLDEAAGAATAADVTGRDDAAVGTGVSLGATGVVAGDTGTAAQLSGSSTGVIAGTVQVAGPQVFSLETWFRSSGGRTGKLIGFGTSATGTSSTVDRHVYLDAKGRLNFGVLNGSGAQKVVTSSSVYNDGQWHQVVATFGSGGMALYADGALVARDTTVTLASVYHGYWRVGGDKTWSGTSWFTGTVDNAAVYPTALSAAQVLRHYQAGTGTLPDIPPTASATATVAALAVHLDASGSADADGTVVGYAWDFGDGGTGTGVSADHTYATSGTYTVTLTVTDDRGVATTTTTTVTVLAPVSGVLAADAFGRTVSNGWGTADVGGAWTGSGVANRLSVAGAAGLYTLRAGDTVGTALTSVSSTGTHLTTVVGTDKVPGAGGIQLNVAARWLGSTSYYGARVKLNADGTVALNLVRSGTLLAGGTVAGLTVAGGDQLHVVVDAVGSGTTTLRAKVWKVGTAEPTGWTVTTTDTTAGLQAAGGVGVLAYLSASATNAPVTLSFTALQATAITS